MSSPLPAARPQSPWGPWGPAARPWRSAWMLLAAVQVSCGFQPVEPRTMQLTQVRPRELSGVYLNEPIVLHFSEELDRASVNRDSLRIATRAGVAARVTRLVEGNELRLVPDPVRARDLSDGGFLPDTIYVVEVAGFPRPDGLRGKSGAPLLVTRRFEFKTVAVTQVQSGYVFLDDSPDRGLPMRIVGARANPIGQVTLKIGPTDGILLEGEEPIDPSTLYPEDFALHGALEDVAVRAVLVDNHNRSAWPPQGTTLVRLVPREPLVPGQRYRLRISPNLRLRDFSRRPVPVIGRDALVIEVEARDALTPTGEHFEEFTDSALRSSAFAPGADGTAQWRQTGRVEVRYPAAAGSGIDGDVELGASEPRPDVQATHLSLAKAARCELSSDPGPILLRSQGALVIDGTLTRRAIPAAEGEAPLTFEPGETLSRWLERAEAERRDCTVLIAGGDLWIGGEVDVSGPLVLVAGGRIRVSGSLVVGGAAPIAAGRGESGVLALWPHTWPNKAAPLDRGVEFAEGRLAIDPPLANPLVRPLRLAVRSNAIPQQGAAARWRPLPEVHGHSGAGSIRVRYIGERARADAAGEYEVVADDPALLVDCPTLRLLIELEVLPGATWDPPWVDSVRVRWELPGSGDAR